MGAEIKDNLIGKSAVDVVIEIARLNPNIKIMLFTRYSPKERDEPDLFWHFSRDQVLKETEIRELTSPRLIYGRTLMGFVSLVEMITPKAPAGYINISQEWAEIPMLFFTGRSPDSKIESRHIKELLRINLGQMDGWVISAPFLGQEGYYYCGTEPIPTDEWKRSLMDIRGLKDSRVSVSNRYIDLALWPKIARQVPIDVSAAGLIRPYATMRIGTNDLITQPPTVVNSP